MRKSGIVARCALLAFAALGGCKSEKDQSFLQVMLSTALYRPNIPNVIIGKASVGSTVIERSTPQYFMDIVVDCRGPTVPTDHAVYVVHGNLPPQYIGTITLAFSPDPAPSTDGRISGIIEFPLTEDQFDSIHSRDEVVIDQYPKPAMPITTPTKLFSGSFH